MRRLAALNLAQRIVVVVALAVGLRTTWSYLASSFAHDDGGWFNYVPGSAEPLQGVTADPYLADSGSGLMAALLAIVFIIVWAIASMWLLGRPYPDSGSQGGPQMPASN